jgi:L-ascorbate metabolism protein UlaG (beta-lactamase superfamily)
MRVTKFGHSCVRLSYDGRDVVLDPGVWSQREALDGVAAVLITHEHPDHWTIDHLRATDAPIRTIRAVADQIAEADPEVGERVTVVEPGERFEVAGFEVEVVGRKHAVIHPELPHFDNSGYVLEAGGTSLFHPGDSFELPGRAVDVHCAPVSAPWAKMSELLDVAREIAAPRTLGIHDRIYSDVGLAMADDRFKAWLGQVEGTYARPADGQDLQDR